MTVLHDFLVRFQNRLNASLISARFLHDGVARFLSMSPSYCTSALLHRDPDNVALFLSGLPHPR
jgi:hypothetical protein